MRYTTLDFIYLNFKKLQFLYELMVFHNNNNNNFNNINKKINWAVKKITIITFQSLIGGILIHNFQFI